MSVPRHRPPDPNRPLFWDDEREREVLRAWLETVGEADRTPWAAFCLGAMRYRLVADAAERELRARVREQLDLNHHLERKLKHLEPDSWGWLREAQRARTRVMQLEEALRTHGIEVPPGDGAPPPEEAPRRIPDWADCRCIDGHD